jgi:hypothetical protein
MFSRAAIGLDYWRDFLLAGADRGADRVAQPGWVHVPTFTLCGCGAVNRVRPFSE